MDSHFHPVIVFQLVIMIHIPFQIFEALLLPAGGGGKRKVKSEGWWEEGGS